MYCIRRVDSDIRVVIVIAWLRFCSIRYIQNPARPLRVPVLVQRIVMVNNNLSISAPVVTISARLSLDQHRHCVLSLQSQELLANRQTHLKKKEKSLK